MLDQRPERANADARPIGFAFEFGHGTLPLPFFNFILSRVRGQVNAKCSGDARHLRTISTSIFGQTAGCLREFPGGIRQVGAAPGPYFRTLTRFCRKRIIDSVGRMLRLLFRLDRLALQLDYFARFSRFFSLLPSPMAIRQSPARMTESGGGLKAITPSLRFKARTMTPS